MYIIHNILIFEKFTYYVMVEYTRLNEWAFGFALGLLIVLSVFFFGIVSLTGAGMTVDGSFNLLLLSFSPTLAGLVAGMFWGFGLGFVGGFIFARAYNFFIKRYPRAFKPEF